MRRRLRNQPITVRITAGFLCAMAVLLALTGAFIYERMQFALNRSIHDVPSTNRVEIRARERHRDEALHELLVQLTVAFSGTLLISGIVGYRVARVALNPVERMRRRASTESADASFRLPVPETRDELSRLAETLNELFARVQTGVERERRLIADASHELRTPLSQLLLRVDLALSRERSPEDMRAALVDLRQDTQRLVRLANDLLLIARADEGRLPIRPEHVAALELVEESVSRFEDSASREGRTIELDVDAELALRADRERLAQALDNLIENAIRHGTGTVTVSASARPTAVAIEVRDEGAGFDPEFAGHAFDRFTTADAGRSEGSSGLGLAIVAAIAAAHGGRATVLDGPGGAIEIVLPTAGVDRVAAAPVGA